MNHQTPLPLDEPQIDRCDEAGFRIGWDHARHGLVPPAELLIDGTPIAQGWRAGCAVFAGRTAAAHRHVRQWLALRTRAWRDDVPFDTHAVTPNHLAQIEATTCPIARVPLGGAGPAASVPAIECIRPEAGYTAGNLVVLGQAAMQARAGVEVDEAQRRARRLEIAPDPDAPLDAAGWWRLAALRAFATPLPFAVALRLPLALLPPNRVRVVNAVQGLQALLTLQFLHPRWSERTGAVAALLPAHLTRTDFNLFVGAMAPRVLEAGAQGRDVPLALEDAWLRERVQRRWQHFALSLGEPGVEQLLARVAEWPLPGRSVLRQMPEPAPEGESRSVASLPAGGARAPMSLPAATTPRRAGRSPWLRPVRAAGHPPPVAR